MSILIITNCSSRKRDIGIAPLEPSQLESLGLRGLAKIWVKRVKQASVRVAPLDLYQGRSFSECRMTARLTGAEFYVISAGLGLIHSGDLVPNYSLTISEGSGSLQNWLTLQNASPSDWWAALCEAIGTPSPLSDLINDQSKESQVFIALPASYLEMVAVDLALVRAEVVKNIRIFTSNAGTKILPPILHSAVMPYDDRLEGIANHDGTRTDFPHRALKHFVTQLQGHKLQATLAKASVKRAMDNSSERIVPKREKATDKQIVDLIRANWNDYDGSATKLLRYLRDEALVACEQSRFSALWRMTKADELVQGTLNA
jgi:hypothetical protein